MSVDNGNDSDFNDEGNDEYEKNEKDKKKNSKDNISSLKTEVLIKTEHILKQSRKEGITKDYLDYILSCERIDDLKVAHLNMRGNNSWQFRYNGTNKNFTNFD